MNDSVIIILIDIDYKKGVSNVTELFFKSMYRIKLVYGCYFL